jgi:hypothetical protein
MQGQGCNVQQWVLEAWVPWHQHANSQEANASSIVTCLKVRYPAERSGQGNAASSAADPETLLDHTARVGQTLHCILSPSYADVLMVCYQRHDTNSMLLKELAA